MASCLLFLGGKRWTKKVAVFAVTKILAWRKLLKFSSPRRHHCAGHHRAGHHRAGHHRTRVSPQYDLKMTKFSLPPSFEPTESLKHNHTPKKATILGTVCYLKKYHMHLRKQDVFQYFNI